MAKTELSPLDMQHAAFSGVRRMEDYLNSRAMFLRVFVGQYFQENHGLSGDQPVNMTFRAISSYLPALVMQNPQAVCTTNYERFETHVALLESKLNSSYKAMRFQETLRAWLVDAFFGFGVMKTGLKKSGSVVEFDDVTLDPGEHFSNAVNIENFIPDPTSTEFMFRDASFLGDIVDLPRQILLDDDRYDHDLVMNLPSVNERIKTSDTDLARTEYHGREYNSARDVVSIANLWLPEYNKIVTIPDPRSHSFSEEFLSTIDFDGVESGPYDFLTFTPPVPGEAIPIAPVSMWYDLHNIANDMFKKTIDQALRQKDLTLYKEGASDEMDDIRDAEDGETVATTDPSAFTQLSMGGQRQSNETMLSHLHTWFNYVTGNADLVGGSSADAPSATQAEMIQANQSVSIEDARSILHDRVEDISLKHAYFIWTNPLDFPDVDTEDFLSVVVKIKARSMRRIDPVMKTKRIIDFATKTVPSLMQAAMLGMQMGLPFDLPKAIMDLAESLDIADVVDDWFNDPTFMQRMELTMALNMKSPGNSEMQGGGIGEILQNQQPGSLPESAPSPQTMQNQNVQERAGMAQSARLGAM